MSREGTIGRNGGGATLHVWGLPDEGGLQADEILYSGTEHDGTMVIWHEGARQMTCGGWACSVCGESTREPVGLAS